MNVKQERYDDAEIQALADKIMEASKSRLVIQQKAHQIGNTAGVAQINSMGSEKKNKPPAITGATSIAPLATTNNNSDTEKLIDEESVRGRFGWETIGNNPIPYILRAGEKYCAVRMVEIKILNKYLNFLHQDIYNCTCIRSYYITEAESRLLNEINFKHCDYQYGRDHFSIHDLIVRLSDAIEFYNFLGSCYTKLVSGETDSLSRSGFIRINKESVVPYTVYNNRQYVPLFYFEGETENLKQKANKLEGWDLSYLKFCCKVQGIRNELFAHDSCSVISLCDIKNYFPPGTLFEDYWPKKSADSQLLISANSRNNQPPIIKWTRQPIAPPISQSHTSPSPKPISQPKANVNQMHNVHTYSSYTIGQQQQLPYHPRTTTSAARSTYPAATGNRHMRSPNYSSYSNMPQGPPPLVPTTQAQTHLHYNNNSSANATPNYMLPGDQSNISHNYQDDNAISMEPPPMIPIRQFLANGGQIMSPYLRQQIAQRYNLDTPPSQNSPAQRELQNNYGVSNRQSILINQQPAHQQSSRTQQPNRFIEEQHNITNGQQPQQMSLDDVNCKLITIPEPPTGSNHIPYKMQKALVEGKMLPCINMKPYIYTELLVTLPDLIMNFFNNIPVQSCQRVMKVLGIELYKPNTSQTHVLMESGKCQNINEVVPLVQVRNVIDFMPQLKYMLGGVIPSIPNKRPRNS